MWQKPLHLQTAQPHKRTPLAWPVQLRPPSQIFQFAAGLQVGNILRQSPDLSFPLPTSEQSQTWLLTTYLDEDTRVTRGDGGSVFILVKDVSLSSPPPPPMSAEQQTAAEALML
jgi:hypothetical protein